MTSREWSEVVPVWDSEGICPRHEGRADAARHSRDRSPGRRGWRQLAAERGAGRHRGPGRRPGGQPRRAAGPHRGPERPDGPAARPAACEEGRSWPARTPTAAGGSGRTTSGGSNSSASTWPSSTTSGMPARRAWTMLISACTRRPTCGRRMTRGSGSGVRVHRGLPAAGRPDAQAVRQGPGRARGHVRPGRAAAPAADRERLPDLGVPRSDRGRGQAAAARARGRLGGHGPGARGRLRGAADPGARRGLDAASRSSRARCRSSRGRCSPGGPAGGCARAGTGWSRAAR